MKLTDAPCAIFVVAGTLGLKHASMTEYAAGITMGELAEKLAVEWVPAPARHVSQVAGFGVSCGF